MEKQTVVVFLGDSMLIEGITVSLAHNKLIKSIHVDPATINLKECLRSIAPDLILFELGTVWSPTILSLLSEQPGLHLLALDVDCSRVIIMNSYQRYTKSIEELSQLFQDEVRATPRN